MNHGLSTVGAASTYCPQSVKVGVIKIMAEDASHESDVATQDEDLLADEDANIVRSNN